MVKYWLHVSDLDENFSDGRALIFKDRWKDTLSKVNKKDQIITYTKKKSEFSSLGSVVDKQKSREKNTAIKIELKSEEVRPVKARPFISELSFVTNKKRWYVHFNKAIYEIPKSDFEKIRKELIKDVGQAKDMGKKQRETTVERLKREIATRAPSGIAGLDKILHGGFPINSTVLVTGGPGAGKTILALQFLLHGVKNGEHGVFISMDERPDDLRREALKFGWDLTKYEEEGALVIVDVSYPRSGLPSKEKYVIDMPFTLDNIVRTVYEIISEINGKRVVIDSLPAFGLHFEDEAEVRIAIHRLNNLLLSSGCTSIITSEIIPGNVGISRFGVEEFIARGIVLMEIYREGKEYKRAMTILKMRETDYDLRRFAFTINNKGIEVLPHKVVFFDEAARII